MDIVIVTGSSKGLGLSICEKLLIEKYKVIGISRTKSKKFTALQKCYAKQLFHKIYDFNDTQNIHNLANSIVQEFGSIYALINNAALGYEGVLATMHEKQIDELLRVNIHSPILLSKYIIRSMLLKQRGRVINIGSIIGNTGFNGLSVYGASKASMQGFSKSLARELGRANITVNTISPGYLQTTMNENLSSYNLKKIQKRSPLGRLATPQDVSNMVAFLLSKEANNITGATMTIDAGSTA